MIQMVSMMGFDSFEQYPNDESFGKWAYCL